jgi:hypothetical protein
MYYLVMFVRTNIALKASQTDFRDCEQIIEEIGQWLQPLTKSTGHTAILPSNKPKVQEL